MRTWALSAFILLAIAGRSQNTINNYKYVLVPHRYDFLKSDDQYGLNSTSKSFLEQKGFTVFFSTDNLPPSLAANKCAALVASVTERKAFFSTNLTVTLKDCTGNVVWKSKEGASREKEFFVAYDQALRDAFVSLNAVPYKYDSTLVAQSPAQPQQPATTQPATTSATTTTPATAAPATVIPATTTPATPATVADVSTLYAQPIPNGYQLVDTSPKKVLTLLKTSLPDHFLAQSTETNGIVFKKDGQWHFEYYKDDKLMSQKLDIKF
jgi:hypothetical protein